MENNNSQVIDYEEIFKKQNEERTPEHQEDSNKNLLTLIIYFLLFFIGIGSLIVTAIIVGIGGKSKTTVLISSITDRNYQNTIVLVPKTEFETDIKDFNKIDDLYYSDITNSKLKETYVLVTKNKDEENREWIISNEVITSILNGEKVSWINGIKISETDSDNTLIVNYILKTELASILNSYTSEQYNTINNYTNFQSSLILFFSYIIVFIPLIIINRRSIKDDFIYLEKEHHPALGKILSSFAYMFAFSIVLGLLSTLFKSLFNLSGDSANQDAIVELLTSKGGIFVVVTTVILAPVVEELVFRKSIFGLIKNQKVALIVSATTFGLIHVLTELLNLATTGGFNLTGLATVFTFSISYVGMGIFLSYWYYKNNKNIALLISMHALSNLLSTLFVLVPNLFS
ncbi:CPBP family intramembrane glutamic endopeptidase [Haploplasma axanthum]|uniref:CAAX amino terminal protease self- immunity n=1 Tax=Haploplasma axanthum TaxID=29552 RepID=A0A449BE25_HAPAX|nr:CPBP family intramembrane glutamic endopeptidase [Haploplasma axanthum]VEU80701.1 CAAX amino terminal protease self- immunity [Haploplasma axanthum]